MLCLPTNERAEEIRKPDFECVEAVPSAAAAIGEVRTHNREKAGASTWPNAVEKSIPVLRLVMTLPENREHEYWVRVGRETGAVAEQLR
jgi:hypothetical protein